MHKIFIDDERRVPDSSWTLVKNSRTAIIMLDGLRQQGIKVHSISFDHDLGGPAFDQHDTSRPVMMWMVENNYWPENLYVHTGNPIGEAWLVGMARQYGPKNIIRGYGFNLWGNLYG